MRKFLHAAGLAICSMAMISCDPVRGRQPMYGELTFTARLQEMERVYSDKGTKVTDAGGVAVHVRTEEVPMTSPAVRSAPVGEMKDNISVAGYRFASSGGWRGTSGAEQFISGTLTRTDGWWELTEKDVFWPGEGYSVRVYGWAPAGGAVLSETQNKTNAPVISFVVDTDVPNQTDLLEGVTDADTELEGIQDYPGETEGVAEMTFRHVLAGIRVTALDFGKKGTIRKILVTGVNSRGEKQLMADEWTKLSTPATWEVTPEAGVPESGAMAEYSDNHTILLIPQTCPQGAEIRVMFNSDGRDYLFTVPLAGESLKAGVVKTYTIAFDPEALMSGVSMTGMKDFINTTASQAQDIIIKSYTTDENGGRRAKPWSVDAYSEDGGATWSKNAPSWLTLSQISGAGGMTGEKVTVTVGPRTGTDNGDVIIQTEAEDSKLNEGLRKKAEAGTETEPVDLSMCDYLGNATPGRNTANCYVVHGPGWYKIPLVYGNAIKNGEVNTSAFHNETAGTSFEDSWGTVFTASSSPYITEHASEKGQFISSAKLLWRDSECGFEVQSQLEGEDTNCPYIVFHVPAASISQGNILVAAMDNGGNIVWSWHIWVTGRDLSPLPFTSWGTTYQVMPCHLGWNGWGKEGTAVLYDKRECIIRIKQTGGVYGGMVTVRCAETMDVRPGVNMRSTAPYYQRGRKDPFIATGETDGPNIQFSTIDASLAEMNRYPTRYYSGIVSKYWLWDTDNNSPGGDGAVLKTIYDPCPAGWTVPTVDIFLIPAENHIEGFDKGSYYTMDNGKTIYYPASGRRTPEGAIEELGTGAYLWTETTHHDESNTSMVFIAGSLGMTAKHEPSYGGSIRPIAEH